MASDSKRVILINGPPGSGKDLAATIICNMLFAKIPTGEIVPFRPQHMKFAGPLKGGAHALFNIPYSCEHYEKEFGREWKDNPQPEFYGERPRDVYIDLSEKYIKPRFGKQVFGKLANRAIKLDKSHNTFVFSDSGFVDEAIPVITMAGTPNSLVIELERPGTTFEGDSRSYIASELNTAFNGKLRSVRIPNSSDKEMFTMLLKGAMMKYFNLEASF